MDTTLAQNSPPPGWGDVRARRLRRDRGRLAMYGRTSATVRRLEDEIRFARKLFGPGGELSHLAKFSGNIIARRAKRAAEGRTFMRQLRRDIERWRIRFSVYVIPPPAAPSIAARRRATRRAPRSAHRVGRRVAVVAVGADVPPPGEAPAPRRRTAQIGGAP